MHNRTGLTGLSDSNTINMARTLLVGMPSTQMFALVREIGGTAKYLASLKQGHKLTARMAKSLTAPYQSVISEKTIRRIMK